MKVASMNSDTRLLSWLFEGRPRHRLDAILWLWSAQHRALMSVVCTLGDSMIAGKRKPAGREALRAVVKWEKA